MTNHSQAQKALNSTMDDSIKRREAEEMVADKGEHSLLRDFSFPEETVGEWWVSQRRMRRGYSNANQASTFNHSRSVALKPRPEPDIQDRDSPLGQVLSSIPDYISLILTSRRIELFPQHGRPFPLYICGSPKPTL
jgi:hypothetical protein